MTGQVTSEHGKVQPMNGISRIRYDLRDIKIRLVFVLSGDCGHACGMTTFRALDGTPIQQYVPEADCPIHDREKDGDMR